MDPATWKSNGSIDSDRSALTSTRLQAVVIDKMTGELLESTVFTPSKPRLGQYQWPKDFADHINRHLQLARAGEFSAEGLVTLESSYKNELWAAPGVKVFATHLRTKFWESIGRLSGNVDLDDDHVLVTEVRNKHTDTLYETLAYKPGAMTRDFWPRELATFINEHSLFVAAGKEISGEHAVALTTGSVLYSPIRDRSLNEVHAPVGSDLSFRLLIERWTDVGQIRSDRGCLAGRQLTAVVIDNGSEEILERTSFTPPAAKRGYSSWPKLFADHINTHLKLARAGKFDADDPGTTWSTYKNRLWAALPGTRVFTTALHADAWEAVETISGADLTLKSVVTVQACSALTGKVYETVNFTPAKDRLEAAQWAQDLARYINANSQLLRAGRPWRSDEHPAATIQAADNDTDICYPSSMLDKNSIWVPKGSGLAVRLVTRSWQKSALGIDSDRAALEGRPITAVVIDSVSEEIIETTRFVPDKARRGYQQWPKDCAEAINQHARWMRVGDYDAATGFSTKESTWDNYLWTLSGTRGFIVGCWHAGYWENIGSLGGGDLDVKSVVSVRVCSRVTGKVYETLNFVPGKERLAVDQWTQDLAKHINQHSQFLRAGREWTAKELDAQKIKSEGQELFYPSGNGSGANLLWVPKGSLLSVEIAGDRFQVAAPAPAIPYRVEVDNFSGVYSCKVPLARLVGNNGAGPELELELDVSRSRTELVVSSLFIAAEMDTSNPADVKLKQTISLKTSNGIYHSISRSNADDKTFVLGDVNLIASASGWVVEYKDGRREYMREVRCFREALDNYHKQEIYFLPDRIETPTGLGLKLEWENSSLTSELTSLVNSLVDSRVVSPVMAVLKNIKDDYGVLLAKGSYTKTSTKVTVFPDRNDRKVVCDMLFEDFDFEKKYALEKFGANPIAFDSAVLKKVKFSYANGDVSTLSFHYKNKQLAEVHAVESGGCDKLTCDANNRVTRHVRSVPGTEDRVCTYAYDDKARKTTVSKECGSFKGSEEYHYEAKTNRLCRHVMKNAGHEVARDYSQVQDAKSKTLVMTAKTTYSKGTASRSEVVKVTLDEHGNVIKREEDGLVTEWTYYRGDPEVKEKKIKSTRVEAQTSGTGLIFGWAIDYFNPIGWCNNIFNDKGLTWGTDYERELYFAPRATKHDKKTFGLPLELNYPGDLQFFTRHVESERVYTMNGDQRVDLKWTFYNYATLKHYEGDKKPVSMVIDKKIVFHDPVSADHKKMDSHAGGERYTYSYHTDMKKSGCYGDPRSTEVVLFDKSGKDIANSKREESYATSTQRNDSSTHISYEHIIEESVTSSGLTTTLFKDVLTGQVRREMYFGEGQDKYLDYDAHGRLKTVKFLKQSHSDVLRTYTHGYYRHGELSQAVVSSDANSVRNIFDQAGRLVQHQRLISAATGWRTLQAYGYDSLGRESQCIEYDHGADGRFLSRSVTTISYDDWGRANKVKTDGLRRYSDYDPIALSLTEWSEDADGKVDGGKTVTHFNANETPASMQIQDAAGKELGKQGFAYNSKTELSKISSSQGDTAYEYDAFGRTTVVTQPGATFKNSYPAHTLAPIATGASMQWSKDKQAVNLDLGKQTVDLYGRVTQFERGTFKQAYSYKDGGHFGTPTADSTAAAMNQPAQQWLELQEVGLWVRESHTGQVSGDTLGTRTCYSLQGRVLRSIDAFGQQTHYHYSAEGHHRAQASSQMSSLVLRDVRGRIREERTQCAASGHLVTTTYSHDALGRETERRIAVNGFDDLSIQRTYDDNGRLKRSLTRTGSKNTVIRDEHYTYATSGSLLGYTCSGSHKPVTCGFEQEQIDFEHDVAGGVSKATLKVTKEAYGTHNVINTCTYAGKGISAEELSEISLKRQGQDSGRIISFGNDKRGRLETLKWVYGDTTSADYKLVYNAQGRLHQIEDVKNQYTTAYTYDMAGKLVGRKDSRHTVDLLYRHDRPYAQIRQSHASKTVQRMVLLNQSDACELQRIDTSKAGTASGSAHTLEIKDAHGSIIASYDLAGNNARFFSYTPYGERSTSHDDLSWRGFNGEVLDPEMLGIYHLGHGYRVYSPWMMRFTSADSESPFGAGGANAYAYCGGDPVNYCDPSGHQAIGRYTHSERAYFSDPLVEAIVTGVIGLALGGAGGLASFGVMGAVVSGGLSAAATGLGIGAIYVGKSNPDLAGVMQMLSFALDFDGTFGSVASRPARGAGIYPRAGGGMDMPAYGNLGRAPQPAAAPQTHILKTPSGADLFLLHSHPKNKTLLIDAHGSSLKGITYEDGTMPPKRFNTSVTSEIGFYADHGFTTPFPQGKGYPQVLGGGAPAANFYRKDYPNYLLHELEPEFVAREFNMSLSDATLLREDIGKYIMEGKGQMDYLTPLRPIALDHVFDVLKREGFTYQTVLGLHCRGSRHHSRWHNIARMAIRKGINSMAATTGRPPVFLP
ncbi:RHS repeat-associated core domain-containing protein [Pseudomonas sp. 148P]|uniref:RHS repeat-associated core domain-containing protein n=1 Tax=Pseudomonas ulcerans TaxID=3115852 RepID=A0ABU7HR24_9PSED|nr:MULTISPECIES: RHS repeat-associated core domain-containing protein [unclassified Pseudomonas]MEE1923019.1 RHS repeat-associated core domain-containing protein [Pseudomonas sp. 147P]MEE1933981.1 RHS repeat-associated core domain-containing protein [Pseudomonas sp. 148P]